MSGTFPVSGNIDARGFPFLLMDLHRHGATGSLKVDGPAYQKALYFRAGRILFGSSNDPRDQLGAILIDAGRLTPEQLEEVNTKVGPGSPLAKVLADSGLVTQQELSDAARSKVERILGDVLSYQEGSFEFEDGVLPKGAVDLKLQTDRLVLGAVKLVADRAFVLGHLGSLGVVLAPTAEMGARAADIRTEAAGLVDQFDGRRTLKEAIGQTPVEEFEAAKIACALFFLGLVAPVEGTDSSSAAPSTSEETPFFVSDAAADSGSSAADAFDLGSTARMALADEEPTHESAPAPPIPATTGLAFADEPEGAPAPEVEAPPVFAVPAAPVAADSPPAASPAPFAFAEPPPAPEAPPGWAPSSYAPAIPSFEDSAPPPAPESDGAAASFPSIAPPTDSDLRTLDTLLSRGEPLSPSGLSSPPRLPPRAIPRFVPQGSGARARAGGPRKALGFLVLLLALAAAGGGGAWWYLTLRKGGTTPPFAPANTPLPPPTLAARITPEPPAPGTSLATPAPPPQTPTSPAPTPVPPRVVATAPASTPPATVAANPGDLLRAGRLNESGHATVARLRGLGSRHTVQILVACSEETIQKALTSVSSPELFIVPVKHKGRDCHRLCWGVYDTVEAAAAADRQLPPYFRQGGAVPRVVTVTSILP